MKIRTRLSILSGDPGSTPFLAVFFLLLVFFLLSSSFVQVSAIKVELPSAPAQSYSAEKLVVTIDKDSKFYFNDQEMDLKTLVAQLGSISSKRQINTIILRADKTVQHQIVSQVLSLANSLNLNVYFAMAAAPSGEVNLEKD